LPVPSLPFRLQRLLELREAERRGCAARLGLARAQEEGADRDLRERSGQRQAHLEALRQGGEGPLDLDAWLAELRRYQGLRRAERAAAERLGQAREAVGEAAAAYLQARQANVVLQRLRDRRRRAWEAARAAAEQAALDEAALRRVRLSGAGTGGWAR
jgi:flagellar export protein FliJ